MGMTCRMSLQQVTGRRNIMSVRAQRIELEGGEQLTAVQIPCRRHHRRMVSHGYAIGHGGLNDLLGYNGVYRSRIGNSHRPWT